MNLARDETRIRDVLLTLAALVVLVAGLRAAGQMLLPVLLAFFLALLSLPLLESLRRAGLRLGLAMIVTVLADVAVLAAFGLLAGGAVREFTDAAPLYLEQLVEGVRTFLTAVRSKGWVPAEWVTVEALDPGRIINVLGGLVRDTVTGVASLLLYTVLVTVIMVCVLYEATGFEAKARIAFGRVHLDSARLRLITREIQHYLGIKTLVSVATGLAVGILLSLLGVDFALLWAFLAFLLNYIPSLGSIFAAVPAILLALLQRGPGVAGLALLGYLLVNLVLGHVLEPQLMGRRFGLSTLVVFLALLFWGWVWGPVGMLLSVPLTMALKIVCQHTRGLGWIAVLMGRAPEPMPSGSEET